MSWRRRSFDLLDLMRQHDQDGHGLSLLDLMGLTGESRARLAGSLTYLEDIGAVTLHLDAERKRWAVTRSLAELIAE